MAPIPPTGLVGYRARRYAGVIDVDAVGAYEANQFWEAVQLGEDRRLVLDPHEFYILASKESVSVPPAYVAKMAPFDPLIGEYRVHYAGFFDRASAMPRAKRPRQGRARDAQPRHPFHPRGGQIVGRLVYDRLTDIPDQIYGQGIGSHYQAQGLKLSKHSSRARPSSFRRRARRLGAMRVAELNRALLEHGAVSTPGFGERRPHLEGGIVGKQCAGQHDRSFRALPLHHHAARGAHHVLGILVQNAPAGFGDLRHVCAHIHLGEQHERGAIVRIDSPVRSAISAA